MFITKMAMSRRTLLRGIGATLALPLLDGMVPALTALAKTPGKPSMGVLSKRCKRDAGFDRGKSRAIST